MFIHLSTLFLISNFGPSAVTWLLSKASFLRSPGEKKSPPEFSQIYIWTGPKRPRERFTRREGFIRALQGIAAMPLRQALGHQEDEHARDGHRQRLLNILGIKFFWSTLNFACYVFPSLYPTFVMTLCTLNKLMLIWICLVLVYS
jgi:hypothetical protein